jgi:hypothetical protein
MTPPVSLSSERARAGSLHMPTLMPISPPRSPHTPAAIALLIALGASGTPLAAQNAGPNAAAAPMINQSADPLLKNFRFRNIGPASMGGRIHDIEVSESDPSTIYLGYAVGGIWKSVNNGTTFTPVFDTYEVASFGDLAIHPTNPDIVYAGSGEANNRQSSSFGGGMYKTTDGGKTWQLQGLRETQSIARVVIDPRIRRQCTQPSLALCSAPVNIAAFTRPPTAAEAGTRSNTSTRTPASRTSRSIAAIRPCCTPRAISVVAPAAASTAADPAAHSGKAPTAAARGPR